MSSQFAELYTECERIEGVQETVNSSKAWNSRPSITSLRSPIRCCYRCATHERGERIRTEKLQSLTSQMLLTRLGLVNTQALAQGVDKLLNANMR